MKLVVKLTLALVLGMSLALAVFGYRSVRRERALLDGYRHRGEDLVLHALSAATSEVWRRDGRAEALRLIDDADSHGDGLRLRWVWLDAPAGDPWRPTVPVDVARRSGEIVHVDDAAGAPRAFVYAPVDVGEGRAGAIELSESLEEEEQFVRDSMRSAALAAAALALLGGAMALGLGAFFVGRPVRRIVEKTRRIGEGDLGEPLVLGQRDELAQVAQEINLMCERLGEARAALAHETTARLAAREQLRHADRLSTVGKLASGVAHELGTPLNVVSGRAKRILRGPPPEEASENARIIVEQAERMTRIIRQLLDFARRREAQMAPADVAAIAREVLALLAPIAQKQGVALVLAAGEAPAQARVDAGQIHQALINLVMNGIQAMPSGGALTVTVGRARATPPLTHGGPEADCVVVCVRDEGEGIQPGHLPHVFEPFFTTKDVGEGTGLGLSVTHGLVVEHGGWIDVASEPGQGSTFTVHLHMRGLSRIELCRRVVELRPDVPVVVITAFGSIETAVEAIRAGAYDYVTKPVDADALTLVLDRAIEHGSLRREVRRLRRVVGEVEGPGELLGQSAAMRRVHELLARVAEVDASVLITGESGTGKEVVARLLHARGRRRAGPFVAINCAAVPEALLESELFGHARGAFTDARTARTGLFVQADGGTLFLDEIGELPLGMQPKLLRALQERVVRPLGGAAEIPFDARIVVATNRDLETAVEERRFREDLYYRVNVLHVELPPLRARGADVLLLAQRFVEASAARAGKRVTGISPAAAERLLAYAWPGNVRELENAVERAVALARDEQITAEDLPTKIREHRASHVLLAAEDPSELVPLEEVERRYVLRVLESMDGNKTVAARILGLDRKTLYRKLERWTGREG